MYSSKDEKMPSGLTLAKQHSCWFFPHAIGLALSFKGLWLVTAQHLLITPTTYSTHVVQFFSLQLENNVNYGVLQWLLHLSVFFSSLLHGSPICLSTFIFCASFIICGNRKLSMLLICHLLCHLQNMANEHTEVPKNRQKKLKEYFGIVTEYVWDIYAE